MGALLLNMKGGVHIPDMEYTVIPGGAKLTKEGKIKKTPTNGKGSKFVYPIKTHEDALKMAEYLWSKVENPNARKRDLRGYGRDYLYFVIGINTGFRYSDMVNLTWGHFFCKDMRFHDIHKSEAKREQKTGKLKLVTVNDAIKKAIQRYVDKFDPELGKDVLVFSLKNQRIRENTKKILIGNPDREKPKYKTMIDSYTIIEVNGKETTYNKDDYKPVLSDTSVGNFIKDAANHIGLDDPLCTHSLRKTYAWLMRVDNMDNPASMPAISDALNHSSESITRRYFGLDRDMLIDMELNLNAGW